MSFFRITLFSLLFLVQTTGYTQGDSCVNSTFFCSDSSYTYTSLTTGIPAEVGPNYGCLGSQPNINWLHFQISQPGDLELTISSTGGSAIDLDFVCWGPFADITTACLPTNPPISCDYSTTSGGISTLLGTQVGEYYLLAVTNYSGTVTDVTISRTGGTAYAACAGVNSCYGAFTDVFVSSCNPSNGQYTVSSNFLPFTPPTTGELYITNSLGDSLIFLAPFADTIPFSFSSNSDGQTVVLSSVFSDSLGCMSSYSYTAPANCTCPNNFIYVDSGSTCVSACDGIATAITYGGTPPYAYLWDDPSLQSTATATNLCIGSYIVIVTDSNGCVDSLSSNITAIQSSSNYDISNTQNILLGDSVQLCVFDTANAIASYLWQTGDTTSCIIVSPADTTTYSVMIDFCSGSIQDSVIVTVDFSQGIGQYSMEKEVIISPNPAKNQIIDINGKVVQKGKTSEIISFDLSKGVYIIDFQGYKSKKLVVRI